MGYRGGQIKSWPETAFVPPKFTVETPLTQVLPSRYAYPKFPNPGFTSGIPTS
jgi:hypothetical protein